MQKTVEILNDRIFKLDQKVASQKEYIEVIARNESALQEENKRLDDHAKQCIAELETRLQVFADSNALLNERIAELEAENKRLREDAEILRAELKEYKLALEDARNVIKEAVERIKPLWPFVMTWLPDTADRQTEDTAIEVE